MQRGPLRSNAARGSANRQTMLLHQPALPRHPALSETQPEVAPSQSEPPVDGHDGPCHPTTRVPGQKGNHRSDLDRVEQSLHRLLSGKIVSTAQIVEPRALVE